MICPPLLAILWLSVVGAAPAWAAENATESSSKLVSGAFILECENNQICESVARAVEKMGGELRHNFQSDIFNGISVQLPNLTTIEDAKALVAQFKGVKGTWPVQDVSQSAESSAKNQPEDKMMEEEELRDGEEGEEQLEKKVKAHQRLHRLSRRADDDVEIESPWNHLMTHVDKLHEEGYVGSGIKIAVVDTGVHSLTYPRPPSLRRTQILTSRTGRLQPSRAGRLLRTGLQGCRWRELFRPGGQKRPHGLSGPRHHGGRHPGRP